MRALSQCGAVRLAMKWQPSGLWKWLMWLAWRLPEGAQAYEWSVAVWA